MNIVKFCSRNWSLHRFLFKLASQPLAWLPSADGAEWWRIFYQPPPEPASGQRGDSSVSIVPGTIHNGISLFRFVKAPELFKIGSQNKGGRHGIMGRKLIIWGVAEIQKRSPSTTTGDAADMQLLCYQIRGWLSFGICSIFLTVFQYPTRKAESVMPM